MGLFGPAAADFFAGDFADFFAGDFADEEARFRGDAGAEDVNASSSPAALTLSSSAIWL